MSYRLRVSRRAARQIRTAAAWWIENRPKAPDAFSEELEEAFQLVRVFPSMGVPVGRSRLPELRRLTLSRVGYYLYYVPSRDSQTVEVLALWHTRRGREPDL